MRKLLSLNIVLFLSCAQLYANEDLQFSLNKHDSPLMGLMSCAAPAPIPSVEQPNQGILGTNLILSASSSGISASDKSGIGLTLSNSKNGISRIGIKTGSNKESGEIVSYSGYYEIRSGDIALTIKDLGDGEFTVERTVRTGESSPLGHITITAGDKSPELSADMGAVKIYIAGNEIRIEPSNEPDGTRLGAVMSAAGLALLRDYSYSAMARKTDFRGFVSTNRYEQVEINCSQSNDSNDYYENEDRVVKTDGQDVYVCTFSVKYHCVYLNCKETHPHTAPGVCQCSISCSKKGATNTGSCSWQPKE